MTLLSVWVLGFLYQSFIIKCLPRSLLTWVFSLLSVLISHRRSHLTNLYREERTHSLTRCVCLTWTPNKQWVLLLFSSLVPLAITLTSHSLISLAAVDQLHEFSRRILPAVYPEDSVRLVQEAERPGRWVPWISTQGQYQVKKVRRYKWHSPSSQHPLNCHIPI